MVDGRAHALANLERAASMLDLTVCRDRGVFHDMPAVQAALRKESEHKGICFRS